MTAAGPFSGLLAVDLTRVLAGPFATMVLADLGATVVKVEPPQGDDARSFPPFISGKSGYFSSINRGKLSIALNLKTDDDRKVFERLLAKADILVENFRGGTLEKLNYDWDKLHARFPRLIYAAVSGFGHTGPYKERPAYDMVVQAMGGIMSLTGHHDAPPTRVGTSIGDITAGLFSTIGIATALYERERTGKGQKIDVGMLDCQVALLENAMIRYVATGEIPQRMGSRHPSIAPFGAFAAKDGHLVVAAGNDPMFRELCACLNIPAMADDPRYRTNADRSRNINELYKELEQIFMTDSIATWLSRLEVAGIPCGPINNMAGVMTDPQVRARNMVVGLDDPLMGRLDVPGNPIKLSAHDDPATRPPAPNLDADRAAVLKLIES
jgi:CoA:oxalate CoA-transferase